MKLLLKKHKLTQKAIADILGIKQNTVSGYVNGTTQISIDKLSKISQHFRIPIEDLCENKEHIFATKNKQEFLEFLNIDKKLWNKVRFLEYTHRTYGGLIDKGDILTIINSNYILINGYYIIEYRQEQFAAEIHRQEGNMLLVMKDQSKLLLPEKDCKIIAKILAISKTTA